LIWVFVALTSQSPCICSDSAMLTTCDSSINSNRANNVKQCNYNVQLIQWVIVNSVFHGVNVKGFFLLLHLRVLNPFHPMCL